jgi:hypothetical protein
MKTRTWSGALLLAGIVAIAFAGLATDVARAQTKLRIGTYDSRAVAIAYVKSPLFKNAMGTLMSEMKTAKEKNDTKAIARLEREGQLRQAMLHEQGFGTGSVRAMAEAVRDRITALAKSEKLNIVLSKWELVYNDADAEIIDITEKVVDFFAPDEKMKSMTKEIMKQEPVNEAYLIED